MRLDSGCRAPPGSQPGPWGRPLSPTWTLRGVTVPKCQAASSEWHFGSEFHCCRPEERQILLGGRKAVSRPESDGRLLTALPRHQQAPGGELLRLPAAL